jgi:outer membrane murein-binding lipoprotein Lpp
MISLGFRHAVPIVVASLLIGSMGAPAAAQSQNDLRRENQSLRTQVDDLQRDLEAAREEIAGLKAEIERLKQLLEEGPPAAPVAPVEDEPAPEERVTIDESVPEASPRALLAAVIAGHQQEMAGMAMGSEPDGPTRIGYMRRLNRWVARTNRQFKMPIEWHVRIVDPAVRYGRGYLLRLQAVDPKTDVPLGDAFDTLLSASLASRLRDHEQRHGLDDVLLLKGIVEPGVAINEQRLEMGPFDNPRFVGPFVEFGFAVQAQTILPRPEEKKDKKPAEADTQPVDR